MLYNFVADMVHTKKLFADFLQVKCNFRRKRPFCVFEPLIGEGLGETYDAYPKIIEKRVVNFLFNLMIIELFCYIGVTALAIRANID